MLDEYAEDFGTGLDQIPEMNTKSNPQAYQNVRPAASARPARLDGPAPNAPRMEPAPVYEQYIPPQQQYAPAQPPIQQYIYQQQPQPQQYVPQQTVAYQQPYPQPLPANEPRSRINNIFTEESKELHELLKAEEGGGCLKNIIFFFTCILIVVVSFWASYMIGSKLFLPEASQKREIIPGFTMPSVVRDIKKQLVSAADVIRPVEELQHKEISLKPETPIIPPEVQSRMIETEPMKVVRSQTTPVARTYAPQKTYSSGQAYYRVIVGSYENKQQADDVIANIRNDGFPVFMYKIDGKYRLQIGAFKNKASAVALMKKANDFGYNAFISIK